MGKVSVIPAKTETKVVEVEPAKVNLELTMDEAQALRALLGKTTIGDNPLYELFRVLTREVSPGSYRAVVRDQFGERKTIRHFSIRFESQTNTSRELF